MSRLNYWSVRILAISKEYDKQSKYNGTTEVYFNSYSTKQEAEFAIKNLKNTFKDDTFFTYKFDILRLK